MGRLNIKVVPGASRDQIVGWLGDALKIKVTAPPEKGKANEAVATLLAKTLGVRRDTIAIVSGHGSPAKTVDIALMDDAAIKTALTAAGHHPRRLSGGLVLCDSRPREEASSRSSEREAVRQTGND